MSSCSLVGKVQSRIRYTKKHASLHHLMDLNNIHGTLKNQYQKLLHFLASDYPLATKGTAALPPSLIYLSAEDHSKHYASHRWKTIPHYLERYPAEQLLLYQSVNMTSYKKGQNANYDNFTYRKCLKSFWWEV